MRTCTIDDCDKKHLAKGLCSTHYNRTLPERHKKVTLECGECRKPVIKEASRLNRYGHVFCSFICRDLWRIEAEGDQYNAAARAAIQAKPRRARQYTPTVPSARTCICGNEFLAMGKRKYCSNTCANRSRAKRRGKRHLIRRLEIFERDAWTCWLCESHIDPSLAVPHPLAATVDHLVPQSLGGTDEPDNLATAHMSSSRGASLTWRTYVR